MYVNTNGSSIRRQMIKKTHWSKIQNQKKNEIVTHNFVYLCKFNKKISVLKYKLKCCTCKKKNKKNLKKI